MNGSETELARVGWKSGGEVGTCYQIPAKSQRCVIFELRHLRHALPLIVVVEQPHSRL